jgi:uncharacterized repeat protein (TIGR01451 family)
VGGSTVITAQFAAVTSGSGVNTAITAPTTTNGIPVPPSTNSVPHDGVTPGVVVIKTLVSPTGRPAAVGEPVIFAIAVTNTGDVVLDTVPVTDTFATNLLAYVSASPAASSVVGPLATWTDVGPLAVGGSTVITAQFAAVSSGSGVNTAITAPTTTNGIPVPPATNSVPHVGVTPGVGVTKTQVSPVGRYAAVGETVVFEIAVTNVGDVVLDTVPVTDTFNTSLLTFDSANPAESAVVGSLVSWSDVGPLAVGGSTVITAQFTAVSSGSGVNTAITTPTTTNGVPVPPATNSVPHGVANPGYVLTKTLTSPTNRPPIPGETLTFDITLSNTGDVALVAVPVTDEFNTNNLSFLSASPAAILSGNTVIWTNVGPLAQAAMTNLVVTFTAIAATSPSIDTNGVAAAPVTATNHPPVPVATNSATYSIDAPAVIGGLMWWDLDTNGVVNAGEAGMTNILVTLLDSTNGVVSTTRTGTNGVYAFTNLVPGTYSVGFSYTNGWYFSPTNGTNVVTLDSDADPSTGMTPPVAVVSGETNATLNAGVYVLGELGQYVWVDVNKDGIPNENLYKYGLNGVRVSLFRIIGAATNFVGTAVTTNQIVGATTNNGYFNFTGLPFGVYLVTVSNGVPANLTIKTTPPRYLISVGYQSIILNANFGYMYPPLPITLKSFAAVYEGTGVRVAWETGVELDNLGFNVYRSATSDGVRVKLNGNLIPGMGNSQGQLYELRDTVPDSTVTWYYWLEDVSFKFETELHGPAVLRAAGLDNLGMLGNFNVATCGLSRISYAVMRAAGLPVHTLDPAQLKVQVAGRDVAVYVSASGPGLVEGDFVLFYAPVAGTNQEYTVGLGTNAMRMGLVYARPSRAPGDVWAGVANEGKSLDFLASTNFVRYLLADFLSTPVWIMDVTDPNQSKLLYGFSTLQAGTNGLSGVYLSYPGVPSAACTAVGDEAVYEVPVIRKVQ